MWHGLFPPPIRPKPKKQAGTGSSKARVRKKKSLSEAFLQFPLDGKQLIDNRIIARILGFLGGSFRGRCGM